MRPAPHDLEHEDDRDGDGDGDRDSCRGRDRDRNRDLLSMILSWRMVDVKRSLPLSDSTLSSTRREYLFPHLINPPPNRERDRAPLSS